MEHGKKQHEPDTAYAKFVCFIIHRLKMVPNRHQRKKAFDDLTLNTTYNVKQLEADVRAKW